MGLRRRDDGDRRHPRRTSTPSPAPIAVSLTLPERFDLAHLPDGLGPAPDPRQRRRPWRPRATTSTSLPARRRCSTPRARATPTAASSPTTGTSVTGPRRTASKSRHRYAEAGTYTATLTIRDEAGLANSSSVELADGDRQPGAGAPSIDGPEVACIAEDVTWTAAGSRGRCVLPLHLRRRRRGYDGRGLACLPDPRPLQPRARR